MSRTRPLLVLALLLVLAALLPLAPAGAATKHFSQVYTCGTSDDSDHLGSASDLEARVGLGHWKVPNNPGHPCAGGRTFVPSATGITFTFRWYAGTTLIRKSHGHAMVHPGGRYDDLHRAVTTTPGSCHWLLHGKKVSVRVTLAKKGYATKVVTFACFPGVG